MQPRTQRRKESQTTEVRSLPDWKAIERLDKIFGSDSGFAHGSMVVFSSVHQRTQLQEDHHDGQNYS